MPKASRYQRSCPLYCFANCAQRLGASGDVLLCRAMAASRRTCGSLSFTICFTKGITSPFNCRAARMPVMRIFGSLSVNAWLIYCASFPGIFASSQSARARNRGLLEAHNFCNAGSACKPKSCNFCQARYRTARFGFCKPAIAPSAVFRS